LSISFLVPSLSHITTPLPSSHSIVVIYPLHDDEARHPSPDFTEELPPSPSSVSTTPHHGFEIDSCLTSSSIA
jgi:hypothetical protein